MDIHETPLPGVGVRHDFKTAAGQYVGVVTHQSGRRDLVSYDPDDPDVGHEVLSLTEGEADELAGLLGAARVTGALRDLQQQIEGLAIDWMPIGEHSSFGGRPLGDTQARTRTGVSIVAVVRSGKATPSPGPSFVFEQGDVLVVVGTPAGISGFERILNG